MPLPQHDVLFLQETSDWVCADVSENVYIKEAIYEGDFNLPGDIPVTVEAETLDHWNKSIQQLLANGIKIPMPLGHTTDPEKGRGEVIGAHVGENREGKRALYIRAKFNSKEAADANKHTQVSIFSPPEFVDGKGNRYTRPITHVALTDYPVIPKLQGFQSIAASFVNPSIEESTMPLKELATRLSIECEDDAQLEDTIVASFEALQGTVTESTSALTAKDEEIVALKAKLPKDPITVTASHVSMLKDNRTMKLDRLVGEKISPAVRDELVGLFCSDESLTLSLSTEAGDGGLFDKLISVLAKNETVKLGESGEPIALSKDGIGDPEENPLLADVEKRKKRAG